MEDSQMDSKNTSFIELKYPSLHSEEFRQLEDQDQDKNEVKGENILKINQEISQELSESFREADQILKGGISQEWKPDSFQSVVEMLEKVESLKLLSQSAPCDYYRTISEQCSFRKFSKGNIIFLKNERKVGFYGLIEGRVALWQPKNHIEIEEEMKQQNQKKQAQHHGVYHNNTHSNSQRSIRKTENQKDEQFVKVLTESPHGERFFIQDEKKQNSKLCSQKLIGIFGSGSSFNEQEVVTGERAGGTLLAIEECLFVVIKREEFTKIFAQQILKLRIVREVLFSVFGSSGNKKSAESLERVSGYFREFQFEYQNTIFEEGQQSDDFYVIFDGEVQKFHSLKNSNPPSSPLLAQKELPNELPQFPSSERRMKILETKGGIIAKGGLLGLSDCILNIPRSHSARCISARASLFGIKRHKFFQVLFDNEDYGLLEQVKKLANAQQKLSQHLSSQSPPVLGQEYTLKYSKEINSPSQLSSAAAALHSESKFRISNKLLSVRINHDKEGQIPSAKATEKQIINDQSVIQESNIQPQQNLQEKQSIQTKEPLGKTKTLNLANQIEQVYDQNSSRMCTIGDDDSEKIKNKKISTKISNSVDSNSLMPDEERLKQKLKVNMTIQNYRNTVLSNEETPEFNKIKRQVQLQRIRKPKPPTFSQTGSKFFYPWLKDENTNSEDPNNNRVNTEPESGQNNASLNGTIQFLKKGNTESESFKITRRRSARDVFAREKSIGQSPIVSQSTLQVGSARDIAMPSDRQSPIQKRSKFQMQFGGESKQLGSNNFLFTQTLSNRTSFLTTKSPKKISNSSSINLFAFSHENENANFISTNSTNEVVLKSEHTIHPNRTSDAKIFNPLLSNSHQRLPSQFAINKDRLSYDFQLPKNLSNSSVTLPKRTKLSLNQTSLQNIFISPPEQADPEQLCSQFLYNEKSDDTKPSGESDILIGNYQFQAINKESISPFDPATPTTVSSNNLQMFYEKNPLQRQLQELLHPLKTCSQPSLPFYSASNISFSSRAREMAKQSGSKNLKNGLSIQGEGSCTNKTQIQTSNEALNFSSAFASQISHPTSCKMITDPIEACSDGLSSNVLTPLGKSSSIQIIHSNFQNNSVNLSHSSISLQNNNSEINSNKQSNNSINQHEAQRKVIVQHAQHSQFRLLSRIVKKSENPLRLSQDISEREQPPQEQLMSQSYLNKRQAMKRENQRSVDRALPFTNSLIKEKIKDLLQVGSFKRPLPAYQSSKASSSSSRFEQTKYNQSTNPSQPLRKQLFLETKSLKQIKKQTSSSEQTHKTSQALIVNHTLDNQEVYNSPDEFEETLSPIDWKQRGFSQGRIGDRPNRTPSHQNFNKNKKLLNVFAIHNGQFD